MKMRTNERIFVLLHHGSKRTRHIGLPSFAKRQRLADRIVRRGRGQGEHIRQRPLFEAGGDGCREEFPHIRLSSGTYLAASGLVAVQDIHYRPHSEISLGREGCEFGGSLGGHRRTYDFNAGKKTIDTLLETKSQSATSRLLRLTFDQVHHVMERAVKFGLLHRSKAKSYNHIHIDEKSVHGRDFASILYDDDGTVLEVVGGRKKENAKDLIDKALNKIQQANVLTVGIDMWDPFRDAVKELMPMAAIYHDKFHLVKHLNGAVDSVRRREVKHQQELKRKRYLFLKDKANFTDKQHMEFDAILKANYETSRAWRIKEDFRNIIKGRHDRAEAFTLYMIWRRRALASDIPEINKVVEMFDRHERGVLNALYMERSNGKAERMNGSIQELQTVGRGYRDVERFRIAVLFFHGGLALHKDHLALKYLS